MNLVELTEGLLQQRNHLLATLENLDNQRKHCVDSAARALHNLNATTRLTEQSFADQIALIDERIAEVRASLGLPSQQPEGAQ